MLNIISQASDFTHGPPLICLYVIMPFSPLLERYYKDLFDNRVDYNFHKGSKWGRGGRKVLWQFNLMNMIIFSSLLFMKMYQYWAMHCFNVHTSIELCHHFLLASTWNPITDIHKTKHQTHTSFILKYIIHMPTL